MKELRVGVVGYCPPTKFDEAEAKRMIVDAYNKIRREYPEHEITIVSGLTDVGVLKIAYREATRRGWKTVGVACKKAEEHSLYLVDEKIIVGENWGDESPTFLAGLDAMVRIGLGKQSLRETQHIKTEGKPTYEYDLPVLEA